MNITKMSDEMLINLYRGGDKRALGPLLDRYRPVLRNYISARIHDYDAVEEIAQIVSIKIMKGLLTDTFRAEGKFRQWMITIASNQIADEYKKAKRMQVFRLDYEELPPQYRPSDAESDSSCCVADYLPDMDAHEQETLEERITMMNHYIQCLPAAQRDVVISRLNGKSFNEIATEQHSTLGTALGRMHYALKRLRTLFAAA